MKKFLCKLWPFWFHRYELIETYDEYTRKLRCTRCGVYFAMSDRHRALFPWDEDFEEITCSIYGLPRTKL